jgi:AraC-like DNA-binding protein
MDPLSDLDHIPRPLVAMAKEFPKGHTIPSHSHNRSQLLYASAGVMTVETARGRWVVPPLRAVWVPAGTEHRIDCASALSMRTIYIKPDAFSGLPRECRVVSVPPLLRELILRAVSLPIMYEPDGGDERLLLMIPDLILELETAPLTLPIPGDSRLKGITDKLMEKPHDNRTLAHWGDRVGAHSRTLSRLFKSETGMGFRQWRQQARILEGLKMLGQGEPVTTVALDLGYDSPSAFIAMFKRALGVTPGRYFKS